MRNKFCFSLKRQDAKNAKTPINKIIGILFFSRYLSSVTHYLLSWRLGVLGVLTLLVPLFGIAANKNPLLVDQAFQLSVQPTNTDSIIINWQIAPGYYLYKNRLMFKVQSPEGANIGMMTLPMGNEKQDKFFGKQRIYQGKLSLAVPILNPRPEPLKLLVSYQGCAEWGFCYPPESKLITINNVNTLTANDISIASFTAPHQAHLDKAPLSGLQHKNPLLILLIFFGLGILLTFTPCVLPMIPIISGIIVGHSKTVSTRKAFSLSLVYVLGMAISFAIAGLMMGLIGNNIQAVMQQPWIIVSFSLFFILLAFSLFGFYELHIPQKFQDKITRLSNKQHAGHYLGVFVMGVLSTLIVSPCVTSPLVAALAFIGSTGNALFGGITLFALGLGMGAPLLIIGTSLGKLLPKAGYWMNAVNNIFGVILLGVAIWILQRIIPGSLALFLWASLAIITSIYMGALSRTPENGWGKLWQGLGIILLTYGILLVIGSAKGNDNFFQPLATLFVSNNSHPTPKLNFIHVKSIADVNREIKRARQTDMPVLLDFYADWCVACKEMERDVFAKSVIQNQLSHYLLLKADVTENDATDKMLMHYYGVIAPPTLIFFDIHGEEIKFARIVGEINVSQFAQHLRELASS